MQLQEAGVFTSCPQEMGREEDLFSVLNQVSCVWKHEGLFTVGPLKP